MALPRWSAVMQQTPPASSASDAALRTSVTEKLAENPVWVTAATLRPQLPGPPTKLELNRVLYGMKDAGLVDFMAGSPPTWRVRRAPAPDPTSNPANPEPLLHVVVDLGNCHDCLQNLIEYAEHDVLTVAAYADLAFAGFGVSPTPLVGRNLRVFQADTPDKNGADVQIIWDISRLVDHVHSQEPSRRMHIVVATKDLGFQRLKALVEANPLHKLTFVTNWATLRLHVE
jgi:hypothetical protein